MASTASDISLDPGFRWQSWTYQHAVERKDIARATQEFEPTPEYEAGHAAAEWLKRVGYDDRSCRTWLLIDENGKEPVVAAFVALMSAHLELDLGGRDAREILRHFHLEEPLVPATHLRWAARHGGYKGKGGEIVQFASYAATRVADWQANLALTLDPYDEPTSQMWQGKYGFRLTNSPGSTGVARLFRRLPH